MELTDVNDPWRKAEGGKRSRKWDRKGAAGDLLKAELRAAWKRMLKNAGPSGGDQARKKKKKKPQKSHATVNQKLTYPARYEEETNKRNDKAKDGLNIRRQEGVAQSDSFGEIQTKEGDGEFTSDGSFEPQKKISGKGKGKPEGSTTSTAPCVRGIKETEVTDRYEEAKGRRVCGCAEKKQETV